MDAKTKQDIINANRLKALERIRQRQKEIKNGNTAGKDQASKSLAEKRPVENTATDITKRPKIKLTLEQQQLIDRNRQKALERFKERQAVGNGTLRDASGQHAPAVPGAVETSTPGDKNGKVSTTYIRPSVHKSDYIEYDFSTMQDTFGGFVSNKKLDQNGKPIEMSLNDWKSQQQEKKLNMIGEDDDYELPPMDLQNAPTCFECKSIDLDKKMLEIFECRVCKACKEKLPEKYSLLTKTECKEDYFLTEPELADLNLFKRIVKENPHSGTFSRMQLFLRYQIEEYAYKKWGSEESLDKEWLRREEMKKNRREKRFNNKLKEMRKKLRAEELTRNLRASRDRKHVHDWSELEKREDPEVPGLYVKRCKDCGMEIKEILI